MQRDRKRTIFQREPGAYDFRKENVDNILPGYIASHPRDITLHNDESSVYIEAGNIFTMKVRPHITM
jgi:hypothetical protein